MHRKDYELLASIMRDAKASIPSLFGGDAEHNAERMLTILMDKLSVQLALDNPRFDPYRFYNACNF